MKRPVQVHNVQKLTSCLVALSRFISCLSEKALPLYQLMKKSNKFEWNDEDETPFEELKALLSTQPVLAAPVSKEPIALRRNHKTSCQHSAHGRAGRGRKKPSKFSAQSITFNRS